jgi:D-beta-D-heptose 7-phosphate kinase/D-beta-D-heptose 1-phosphate adenosyltransferase
MNVHPSAKILSVQDLLARFGRPRHSPIVFTNGVFDLLHRGHVELLFAARQMGDALIVGLNSDASVRRLKGPGRPLNDQDDRAIVLAALACVDTITFFDEDTPQRLIAELLPDVLVKGADYRIEDVVGRAQVEAAGGRVALVPLVTGRSTSETLRRIEDLS